MFRLMLFTLAGLITLGLYAYFRRTLAFYGLAADSWRKKLGLLAVILAASMLCLGFWPLGMMALLHLLLTDLALGLVFLALWLGWRLFAKKKPPQRLVRLRACGLVQLALTLCLVIYGAYNFNHPVMTEYQVTTEKAVGNYRVALITDVHYCGLQRPEALTQAVAEIQALKPDLVILGGDIVEEGSSKAQMEEVFDKLGGIDARYGVYYVYGNHDRQFYTDSPSYTPEELAGAITGRGITILQDSYVTIGDDLVLAGREDASVGGYSGRTPVETILQGAAPEAFWLVADHQPREAERNAALGVDLQLFGHTHAGQIWPLGHLLTHLGQPMNYGWFSLGGKAAVVSSGFAGWGFPFRTQERSEYVVVDIIGQG